MSDGEESSSGESNLSCSPSGRLEIAGGSDLFKSVLNDYFLDESRVSKVEYDRYKFRKAHNDNDDDDHRRSRRCGSCQAVVALCKCELYNGKEQQFGHRVHWADEVWEKPLTTILNQAELDSEEEDTLTNMELHKAKLISKALDIKPKPILKHKATCIVIVSE